MPLSLSPAQRQFLRRAVFVLCGALVLLWTPLLNGYPLLHSDSGTYLWSAANVFAPVDRAIGYGLFIRTVSPIPSLWLVIFFQALGTSFLLYRAAVLLLSRSPSRDGIALAILIATAFTTSISRRVGWIMPDLFAAWLILASCIFVLTHSRSERIAAGFLFAFALLTHNSYLFVALGVLLLFLPMVFFLREWRDAMTRPLLSLLLVWAITALALGGINFYLRAGFTITRGGSTFLVNRLEQTGMLLRILDDECPATQWALCGYRETLRDRPHGRGWFLWSEESPLGKLGWEASAAEHTAIVQQVVVCCLQTLIQKSADASWRQFWMLTDSTPLDPLPASSDAALALAKIYPQELVTWQHSAQQSGRALPLRLIQTDNPTTPYLWLAAALGLWFAAWRACQWRLVVAWSSLFVTLLVNAIVMGTVSGTADRYQERLFSLIPYLVFVTAAVVVLPSARAVVQRAREITARVSPEGAP